MSRRLVSQSAGSVVDMSYYRMSIMESVNTSNPLNYRLLFQCMALMADRTESLTKRMQLLQREDYRARMEAHDAAK